MPYAQAAGDLRVGDVELVVGDVGNLHVIAVKEAEPVGGEPGELVKHRFVPHPVGLADFQTVNRRTVGSAFQQAGL